MSNMIFILKRITNCSLCRCQHCPFMIRKEIHTVVNNINNFFCSPSLHTPHKSLIVMEKKKKKKSWPLKQATVEHLCFHACTFFFSCSKQSQHRIQLSLCQGRTQDDDKEILYCNEGGMLLA